MHSLRGYLLCVAALLPNAAAAQSQPATQPGYTLKVLSDQLDMPAGPIVLNPAGNIW